MGNPFRYPVGPDPPYWWEYIDQGEGYTPDFTEDPAAAAQAGEEAMIVASDLIAYSPANRPTDDTSVAGGAIAPLVRPVFAPLTSIDDLEAVSTHAGDTGVLTVVARDGGGVLVGIPITLNGLSTVVDSNLLTRILSAQYATAANGTIRLRRRGGGPLIGTIPAGEQGFSAMFKGSVGAVSPVARYDKFFFKNVHASATLTAAVVRLTADPKAKIRIGLAPTINDTVTIPNRLTMPGSVAFSTGLDIPLPVPGNILAPGDAIGVWVEQQLGFDASFSSTFSVSMMGAG